MAIGSIDTNTPQGTAPVSEGDNQIVGIKVDVVGSFLNFASAGGADIVNKTGPEIDADAGTDRTETITGIWTFSTSPRTANDVAWQGRFTGGGPVNLAMVNLSNETEFGNGGTPGRFKSTMTVEGVWTFEDTPKLVNSVFLNAFLVDGVTDRGILGITAGDVVTLGSAAEDTNIRGSAVQMNGIRQPISNYCLSVTNGSTTISDGSGGTSGWSVTVLTGTTIRINHAIGTAAYIVALGPTDSANKAIVFSKGATDFVLSFDTSNPSPVDVMVMVP